MIVRTDLREVIILADPTHEGSVFIDAQVHSAFDYCLDPRRIFDGDPMKVADTTVIPGGVGTTAHLSDRLLIFAQDVPIEYVEVVPDQRIVFEGDWRMTIMGLGIGFSAGIHSWTWSFVPEDEGTRLTMRVVVLNSPRWQRILDRVAEKSYSKQIRERLARIKAAAEEQAATAS